MNRPRILLADDHTLVLEGIKKLLETHFDLAGAAENGRELVAAAARLRPDVILLDISMPLLNGLEAARQIRKAWPLARLIFLTMHADPTYVSEALRAGASGYVLKRSAASELVRAIQEVLKGRSYVTPLLSATAQAQVRSRLRRGQPSGELTARQREVLQLIAEGHSIKEMAAILHISPKTVEFHKACLTQKLGLRTTAELTRYAIQHGIIAVQVLPSVADNGDQQN